MRLPLLTASAVLAFAAPAGAQATAKADPFLPGRPTALTFDVDTSVAPVNGRIPTSITLDDQALFTFDGLAVPGRCTADQGASNTCPPNSRFGSTTVTATAFGMPVTATLGLFLAAPQQPSDLAGLIASGTAFNTTLSGEGRILKNSAGGLQVLINTPASLGALGSSVTVQHVTAQTDNAAHTVVTKKRVKVRKKTRHHPAKFKIKKIKTAHHLLTTPGVCNLMPWKTSVTFAFGDGTSSTLDAPIPCATP